MWLLFYPSCLLLTFSLGFSQSYGHFFDPVYCSTDTPNCTLYINQTVTFICKCSATNCVTSWKFSDNSTPVRSGVNCTRNVTEDLMGVATCHSNSRPPNDAYKWNVTVLHPKPPKFLVTPSGTKTINIGGANGAAATCLICVNCTVRGAPAPTVTWQYQSGNMFGFNSVITNQSNASSPYYQLDNGQKLCFDDVRRYDLVDGTTYQCTATNVGGTISTTFNALVHSYPLPIPGPSATTGTLYSGGKNVTLLMDSVYPGSDAYFKVYRYNRSSPDTLISSCYCNGPTPCEFGELAGHTEKNYVSCQLNTSYSGLYQFQIYTTTIYPCFLNIGHPIEVNDVDPPTSTKNFKMNFYILSYSLGGLCVLLVVGILGTFCGTRRFYRRQPQRYAVLGVIHTDDSRVAVSRSLLSPNESGNNATVVPATNHDYGSVANTTAESVTPAGASMQPAIADEQLPLQVTDDDITVPIPSTCKASAYRKTVYITHSNDSEQWVVNTLIPFLRELKFNVEVVRISDAIPGKPKLSARLDFINEASKTILVISKQSIKDGCFLYDTNKALYKDPGSTKMMIIPILYENVAHSDIPEQIAHLTSISYNDPGFVTKITKSINFICT